MLVNGQRKEHLGLSDRAVHYGDGLFETALVRHSQPLLWNEHLQRLEQGAKALKIPCNIALIQEEAQRFLSTQDSTGILKFILTRGEGGRGYTPPISPDPTRIFQFHPIPENYEINSLNGVATKLCLHPLSINPALAGIKHLNRLDQVMASLEMSPEFVEGLMCDPEGNLIEGIKSNVFIIENGTILTPDLARCGIAGVMRAKIIQIARASGIDVQIAQISQARALQAQELFVCNSVMGIWPIITIQGPSSTRSYPIGSVTRALISALDDAF